jgi:hypothetical protein
MAEIIRLLRCDDCYTIEPLPDYDGPPEHDTLLGHLIAARHTEPSGTTHRGKLLRIDKRHWDSPSVREAVIARVREESGHTGLDPAFYNARDTFQEDALVCWQQHHRSTACNEYKSDRKRLTPATQQERKELGMGKFHTSLSRYLCEFCPVHSLVVEAARHKAGLYK